ncbi:MAG TPA: DeoR/GlpR family DNA-binding transcription regulator [Pseudolabrys sp.]|nr:DeoR/GlpR family DNA-binding transcription regulator [Pseudolabrys sp.]
MTTDRQSTSRVALIPAQRQAMILELLQADGAASVQQFADTIGASVATIRRDLETLESKGFLDRTFGGASLRARALARLEPGHAVSAHIRHDEKVAIGLAAAARIEPHQSVIFDSSSTVREAAQAILRRDIPFTAITNDLLVAQTLANSSAITVITIGGRVRPGSMTLFGPPGEEFLLSVKADVALIGAHAVTLDGPSEVTIEITCIKQLMAKAARSVRVLADHTKLGDASTFRICGIGDIDELVTDWKADPAICAALRERGATVTIAAADAG